MTYGLMDFLGARLDEDDAAATPLEGHGGLGIWDLKPEYPSGAELHDRRRNGLGRLTNKADAVHIVRHDPARTLREVAAGRALLELHKPIYSDFIDADGDDRDSVDCDECDNGGLVNSWPCKTLLVLAAVWADHPDYDQRWKL